MNIITDPTMQISLPVPMEIADAHWLLTGMDLTREQADRVIAAHTDLSPANMRRAARIFLATK